MTDRPHPAELSVDELLRECRVTRTKRSGPGGQHRNKVETAVVIEHIATGTRGEAGEQRSQAKNRTAAIFRLRLNLAIRIRTPREGSPSPLWSTRCAGGRIQISPRHEDFPAVIAEALDVLSREELNHKSAATALGCSVSQFVRLLRQSPTVFQAVNALRDAAGLHRLS